MGRHSLVDLWWILFTALVAANHLRVRRRRRGDAVPKDGPALRDPASMKGLAVEGLAYLLLGLLRHPADWAPSGRRRPPSCLAPRP